MAFKLSLAMDARQWLKGTTDVEKSLNDVADSLDDLARNSARDADKAADDLSREFRTAFDKVQADAKTTGDGIGDDLKRGAREASEGTDAFKENANSNLKEVAASFDGSADSIVDGFQGLAAEALEGFGPAGIAAGAAVAAGLGLATASLQDAAEKAEEAKAEVVDLAKAMIEAGDASKALTDNMTDMLFETVDTKEWFEVWQTAPTDAIEMMEKFGLSYGTVRKAIEGDAPAIAEANRKLTQDMYTPWGVDTSGQKFLDWINQKRDAYQKAGHESSSAAAQEQAALKAASDASATFSESLTENLSVADDGLEQFVKKGKLNLEEWSKELRRRQRENERITDFTIDIAPKLSAEALENFAQLPIETQAQIEKAYRKGGKADRKKIVANLEAEAKIDKVTIDDKSAKKAAEANPVEVPVTVNTSGLSADVAQASNKGQREANQQSNEIEFKTRIDRAELQRQVNRAAASITAPTITVKTRVQKEVP